MKPEIQGFPVHVQKVMRDLGLEDLDDRIRFDDRHQAQHGPQHTQVENNGLPDLIHDFLVHPEFHLARIHLSRRLHEVAVGKQKPSRPDGVSKLVVSLLGEAYECLI